MEDKILTVKNYSLQHKRTYIIKDLNFELNRGDFLAIGGVPGSGKTTLIRSLLGLVTKGINGEIEYHNIGKDDVNYMSQNVLKQKETFIGTTREVVAVAYFPVLKGRRFDDICWEKVDTVLKKLNLYEYKDKKINKLTKGQLLKMKLGKILIQEPKLIFVDTPTATVDNKNSIDFYETVKSLCDDDLTVIFIAKNIKDIAKYATKILFLDKKNKSYYLGTSNEFLEILKKKEEMKKEKK